MHDEPVVVAARRSAIATTGRKLSHYPLEELAAPVMRAAIDDARRAIGGEVDIADVVLGNCMGPGGNPARVAALAAGLGAGVPGVTVDRQCGSGLAAIIDACTAIRAGDARIRVAGGAESPSTAPTRSVNGRAYARARFTPTGWSDPDMIAAADALAAHDLISRSRQDAHAARSHLRAREARARGSFDEELVVIGRALGDDAIGQAEKVLSRLTPLVPQGTVTAGTSTRVSDGAAMTVVVPRRAAGRAHGLRLIGSAVVGSDPAFPGIGAAPAILDALKNASRTVADVDAFEIVEAFASQSLAVLDRIGVVDDDGRVCADGGALALGHPWGASAAVSVVRLFSRLVRGGAPSGTIGVAAASVGGGMGIAAVFDVVR